jgi:hypothetical protein
MARSASRIAFGSVLPAALMAFASTGLHGYNVVRNDKGNIVFDKRIDFYKA